MCSPPDHALIHPQSLHPFHFHAHTLTLTRTLAHHCRTRVHCLSTTSPINTPLLSLQRARLGYVDTHTHLDVILSRLYVCGGERRSRRRGGAEKEEKKRNTLTASPIVFFPLLILCPSSSPVYFLPSAILLVFDKTHSKLGIKDFAQFKKENFPELYHACVTVACHVSC